MVAAETGIRDDPCVRDDGDQTMSAAATSNSNPTAVVRLDTTVLIAQQVQPDVIYRPLPTLPSPAAIDLPTKKQTNSGFRAHDNNRESSPSHGTRK